jgi:hypothetical protein
MCCENELPFRYSSLLLICNTGGNVKFVVFNSNYSMSQHILHLRKHIVGSNESNHARDDGWTLVKAKAKTKGRKARIHDNPEFVDHVGQAEYIRLCSLREPYQAYPGTVALRFVENKPPVDANVKV